MSSLPILYLARHGQTEWSVTGQHTGLTDIPLTDQGREEARRLATRLQGLDLKAVYTSPLQRAAETSRIAGFSAEPMGDLVEWDYGEYEGIRTADIRKSRPEWKLFRDGCPGGESVEQIGRRVDKVIERLRAIDGNVLVFSSGHVLRVLAARWLGLAPAGGNYLMLSTASFSILSYEHTRLDPAIKLWNDTSHLA